MTSRICSKRYHPVGKLFAFTLKRQTGITLLVTAFLLLICPGVLWRYVGNIYSGNYSLDGELAAWVMVIFLVSLLLGVILLCFNHSHLFSRKSADLYYALPIKRDTMLGIRFGASVIGAVFAMTASFSGLTIVNFLPNVIGIAPFQMLKLYTLCLMLLLLCMSTVLIFIVNSGSIFNFIFSLLVVCVGIPALCLIGYYWYEDAAYGVINGEAWLEYISPFSYAILQLVGQSDYLWEDRVVIEISTLLISVGGTLLFTAISFLMNHHRKTEKAGGSFAYQSMPVLITVLASAMGGYLVGLIFQQDVGSYNFGFWTSFAMGAALVAVAAGAIISKGFRRMWRWIICAGAATAVMFAMFVITDQAGKKDYAYVPEVEDIASITIEGSYNSPEVTLTSDFELVTKLHEHIIAIETGTREPFVVYESVTYEDGTVGTDYRDHFYSEVLNSDFNISYTMKNGKTVERHYWIRDYDGMLMLLDIAQTDAYAEAWTTDLAMEGLDNIELRYYNQATEYSDVTLLTPEETTELLRVYGKELQNAKDDVLWQEGTYVTAELGAFNWLQITIPRSFTETLSLLDEFLK